MNSNKKPARKVTYTIRDDVFEALRLIKEEELRLQSSIVQLALLKYLKENYEKFLKEHGIDLWKKS